MRHKKGMTGMGSTGILITILVLGLLGVIFAAIQEDVREDMTNGSDAELAANNSLDGISNLTERLGLIGTIGGFLIILGMVGVILRMFGVGGMRE